MLELTYHRPSSLTELWSLYQASDGPVGFLAGGTDLVPALKRELTAPAALVDVKRLPELQDVTSTPNGGLRIGAAVTLHALARSAKVAHAYPALAEAAGTVASYQIRNRGTLGGNVCLDTRCTYFNQSAFWRAEFPDCRKAGGSSCYVVPKGDRCHALSSSDLAPSAHRRGRAGADEHTDGISHGGSGGHLLGQLVCAPLRWGQTHCSPRSSCLLAKRSDLHTGASRHERASISRCLAWRRRRHPLAIPASW